MENIISLVDDLFNSIATVIVDLTDFVWVWATMQLYLIYII